MAVIVCVDVYTPELFQKAADIMAGKQADLTAYRRTLLADALMEAKRKKDYGRLFIDSGKFTELSDKAFGTDHAAGKCWVPGSPMTADAVNQAVLEAPVARAEIYDSGKQEHAALYLALDTDMEALITRAKVILADREADERDLLELS